MTLLDGPRAAGPCDRALQLLEDAGVKVTPAMGARIAKLKIGDKQYVVIDQDDIYPVDSPFAVLGATLDCEGVLQVVCLGEST